MKHFILGIDGGDERVFEIFEMPFVNSLIATKKRILLTEDLHSRGWVEIIAGKHASHNNGFYLRPLCDKTSNFTLSYSFNDLKDNKEGPLIWEAIQDLGFSVGIMNVPTTYPAAEVNGFFVSGAGGGLTKVEGIPKEMCSDEEIRTFLENEGYVLDLRLMPSGIQDKTKLFDSLIEMMTIRVNAFIKLSKERKIDFGFLALRAPTVVTYLAMSEITRYKNGVATNEWKQILEKFFSKLDQLIEKLFNELKPENFIVTSDHGVTDQRYHVNFNRFLFDKGYLRYKRDKKDVLKYKLKIFRNVLAGLIGKQYQTPRYLKVNYKESEVFGNYYYNGLYINDERRFGGPVNEEKIQELVTRVCKDFNEYSEAQNVGMKAYTHRSKFPGHPFSDQLPDIWIDAPDEYYFLGAGKKFIQKNPFYGPIKNLKNAVTSMHSGIKARNPVCIISDGLERKIKNDDDMDLTLIYNLSLRALDNI